MLANAVQTGGATMTGVMTGQAVASPPAETGTGITELVKLLREQMADMRNANSDLRDEITELRYTLLKNKTEATKTMAKLPEDGTLANPPAPGLLARIKDSTVVQAVAAETKDASWRGAALMTIDLAKQAIEKAKPFIPKQYQQFHKPLLAFVETPLGGAALAYGAGMLLSAPFMPGSGQGKQKRIAYELRVGATTLVGYTFVKPFVGFITQVALGGFATIMASVPDVAEDEVGVRVDAAVAVVADEEVSELKAAQVARAAKATVSR
jgi:hypothetical protein